MESTSLDDVLYRYASFRNLVDPITHDLIISLARYIHCPKPVGTMDSLHLHNCAVLGNRSAVSQGEWSSPLSSREKVCWLLLCLCVFGQRGPARKSWFDCTVLGFSADQVTFT